MRAPSFSHVLGAVSFQPSAVSTTCVCPLYLSLSLSFAVCLLHLLKHALDVSSRDEIAVYLVAMLEWAFKKEERAVEGQNGDGKEQDRRLSSNKSLRRGSLLEDLL